MYYFRCMADKKTRKRKTPFKDNPEFASECGKKSSNKGQPHKATVLKMNLAEHIHEFDGKLYEKIDTMLADEELEASLYAQQKIEEILGTKLTDDQAKKIINEVANLVRKKVYNDVETKKFVVKELLKYRVAQKREITGNVYGQVIFQAHPDILSGDEEKFGNPDSHS